MSFAALATFGIAVATLLLGFLGYRAMTFRSEGEGTRDTGTRRL